MILVETVDIVIINIFLHRKFSGDSLQEVGKLCEAFLHQEEPSAASSTLPVSSVTMPSLHSSTISDGYTNAASPSHSGIPAVTPQVNQSLVKVD